MTTDLSLIPKNQYESTFLQNNLMRITVTDTYKPFRSAKTGRCFTVT